jgi:hypothetical protein
MGRIDFRAHFEAETFEEALAGLANKMWKDLPEKDKSKIKEILESEGE